MADARARTAEQNAELERVAIRNKLKRQFQRMLNDPRRPPVAIDPAIDRWNYVRQNSNLYFRATPKTTMTGIFMGLLLPGALIYFIVKSKIDELERIEAGQLKTTDSFGSFRRD